MPRIADLVAELCRFVRFGMVGILATLVYAWMTFLGVEFLGLTAVRASIIGQVLSMAVSYLGHSMFSFGVVTDHRVYLWRFLVIAVLTFGMNGVVTWALTNAMGFDYRIVVVIVGVLIPVTNYVCNRFWVFLPGINSLRPTSQQAEPRRNSDNP
jgi:putative flippase GtrA